METLLIRTIHEFAPGSRSIFGRNELERWWLANSLANLVDDMSDPIKDLVRRRTWAMLTHSVKKIHTARTVVQNHFNEFSRQFSIPHPNFVRSLTIYVTGSVARLEAEHDSDIDTDFLHEDGEDTKIVISDQLISKVKEGLARAGETLGDEERKCVPSFRDIEEELAGRRQYDFVLNIALRSD